MSFGDPNDRFERNFPLGEYVHIDLPNDYDPQKVKLSKDFACCISRTSLQHRRWYIHNTCYHEFMKIIDSGEASRYSQRTPKTPETNKEIPSNDC